MEILIIIIVGLIVLGAISGKDKSSGSNGLSSLFKDIMSSSSSSQPSSTNSYKPSQNNSYKPEKKTDRHSNNSNDGSSFSKTKVINVSVVCTNCGNTVVLNLRTDTCGGFSASCHNCAGVVTGSYSWGSNDSVIIRNVRTMGGAKK